MSCICIIGVLIFFLLWWWVGEPWLPLAFTCAMVMLASFIHLLYKK